MKKYSENVLAILPFLLIMVWGNSVALCSIIPVVGGAIGGAISAIFVFISITTMKKTENPLFKILIGLGFVVLTFVVCAAIGLAIIGALI